MLPKSTQDDQLMSIMSFRVQIWPKMGRNCTARFEESATRGPAALGGSPRGGSLRRVSIVSRTGGVVRVVVKRGSVAKGADLFTTVVDCTIRCCVRRVPPCCVRFVPHIPCHPSRPHSQRRTPHRDPPCVGQRHRPPTALAGVRVGGLTNGVHRERDYLCGLGPPAATYSIC